MDPALAASVHEANLHLAEGTDAASVGAAVTAELCGSAEHEGRCRWPHNNAIASERGQAEFRTVFIAPPAEVDEVHGRIALALRSSEGWSVIADSQRPLVRDEERLAERLASTPG